MLRLENVENVYMEPNQITDQRKASAVSAKLADMDCIDKDSMRIIVQRVETETSRTPSYGSTSVEKPGVAARLSQGKNPELIEKMMVQLKAAHSDLNFTNYDQCFKHVCEAISTLEHSA